MKISKICSAFLQLFYPKLCAACGRPIGDGETHICRHCISQLSHTWLHEEKDNLMEQRFYGRADIAFATAYLFFEKGNITQALLHRIKYDGFSNMGVDMGKAFGQELKNGRWEDIDFLVPVPLHPKKLQKRGYNQSECIAKGIGETLGKKVITDVLIRTQNNTSQTKKNAEERRMAVADIFATQNLHKVEGKHIAIVDDVVTTGSTIEACIKAFDRANIKISVLALACVEN